MISIVIPTLNEEKFLPSLLESIKKQTFSDYEIIVADAGSQDKTIEIASQYGCKITKGGLPAKGRNSGAKISKNELILFLDADTIIPEDFLYNALKEFKERKLKIASFCLKPYVDSKLLSLLYNIFYNFPIVFMEKFLPHAAVGIMIEKNLFNQLNGFDETIIIAEDHDLAIRAKKIDKKSYGILKSTKIRVSDRRFRKDGWIKTFLKYLFCELHLVFKGPIRGNFIKYKFNHYNY